MHCFRPEGNRSVSGEILLVLLSAEIENVSYVTPKGSIILILFGFVWRNRKDEREKDIRYFSRQTRHLLPEIALSK